MNGAGNLLVSHKLLKVQIQRAYLSNMLEKSQTSNNYIITSKGIYADS